MIEQPREGQPPALATAARVFNRARPLAMPGRRGRPRTRAEAAPGGRAVAQPTSAPPDHGPPSPSPHGLTPQRDGAVPVGVPAPALPPRLLGLKDGARYLSISTWSVRALIAAGRLQPVPLGLKKILLDVRELDALIDAARRPA